MRASFVFVAATLVFVGCGQFGGSEPGSDSSSTDGDPTEANGASPDPDPTATPGAAGTDVLRLTSTDLCASAAGSGNPNVVLRGCTASTRQAFVWQNEQLRLPDGRCLMAQSATSRSMQAAVVACDKVSDKQGRWRFNAGAQLVLVSDEGRCLQGGPEGEMTDARAGAAVVVVTCNGADAAQRWALQDVSKRPVGTNPNDVDADADDPNASTPGNSNDGNDGGGGTPTPPAVTLDVNTTTNDTSSIGGSKRSYSGPAINFPNDPTRWDTWDNYWSRASAQFPRSNTTAQTGWVKDAILLEAATTGMDARFILAVVVQESSGDVHVRTTNNGVSNPGLMQSHNGATFADRGDGGRASIFQMVKDGVEGTKDGDGLIQGVKRTKNYFAAGRLYNSGTIDNNNLSNALGATGPYCSDLANRVMGRM